MVTGYHSPDYCCRRKPSERIMKEEDYQALINLEYAGECRLLKIHSRRMRELGDG